MFMLRDPSGGGYPGPQLGGGLLPAAVALLQPGDRVAARVLSRPGDLGYRAARCAARASGAPGASRSAATAARSGASGTSAASAFGKLTSPMSVRARRPRSLRRDNARCAASVVTRRWSSDAVAEARQVASRVPVVQIGHGPSPASA